MIALDIVNDQQFQVMVNFAEMKLVHNLEEEHEVRLIFNSFGLCNLFNGKYFHFFSPAT